MNRSIATIAFGLTLACAARASAVGSITDGDAFWQWANTSASSATLGNINFRADSTPAPDQAFQHWFWYRINNGFAPTGREKGFPDTDFAGETYVGNVATLNWTAIDLPGQRFNARLVTTLTDGPSPGQARAVGNLTLTNVNNFDLSLTIFSFFDPTVLGTDLNDSADLVAANPQVIQFNDGADYMQFAGINSTAYRVDQGVTGGSPLRNALNDLAVTNFSNAGTPFAPADAAAAFQWNLTIPANGGQITLTEIITINRPAIIPACATCRGDIDNDSDIDGADVAYFVACYLAAPGATGCACADLNNDNALTALDVTAMVQAVINPAPPPCH